MTINNTQFTQNSAEEGGALNNQFVTYIENSKFTDESDIIYNNGNIVLNNNTKSKGILVNNSNNLGNIYSPTNIILIDGKNKISHDLNEDIDLYGTLTVIGEMQFTIQIIKL